MQYLVKDLVLLTTWLASHVLDQSISLLTVTTDIKYISIIMMIGVSCVP